MYLLEKLDLKEHGPCECCGNMSRMVSGLIYNNGEARAGYQVQWTMGQIAAASNADDEDAARFKMSGFIEGKNSAETVAATPRIVVVGVWLLGSLFLFASVAVLLAGSETEWAIKGICALVAVGSVLTIARFTRRYFAERKAR